MRLWAREFANELMQNQILPDKSWMGKNLLETFKNLMSKQPSTQSVEKPNNDSIRPAMKESLKLDRTIICLNTKDTWKNAYRMWCEHKDWMTSAQQDRLTAQLYAAAKEGEQAVIEINDRKFMLVNV
jgi:hypothetical protein